MATIDNGRRARVTIRHAGGEWTGMAAIARPDVGDYLRVLVQAAVRDLRGASAVVIDGVEHAVVKQPFRSELVPVLVELHVEPGDTDVR